MCEFYKKTSQTEEHECDSLDSFVCDGNPGTEELSEIDGSLALSALLHRGPLRLSCTMNVPGRIYKKANINLTVFYKFPLMCVFVSSYLVINIRSILI